MAEKTKKRKLTERELRINRGEIETKNLAECLKVDFAALFASVFPFSGKAARQSVAGVAELGILKRMDAMAALILEKNDEAVLAELQAHPSDTVRGWAAFVVGRLQGLTLKERLERIRPFADDTHFGVREWAWMAVRGHLAKDPTKSVAILKSWASDPSFRVRRFASEALRPRGVWAEHIQSLKDQPEIALPILAKLNADPERYVQDSVANWMNDAAKSQPDWVRKTCAVWAKASTAKETSYIVKRSLRSLV